jgi:hypothetical protein
MIQENEKRYTTKYEFPVALCVPQSKRHEMAWAAFVAFADCMVEQNPDYELDYIEVRAYGKPIKGMYIADCMVVLKKGKQ